jgi:hypothetical protein
MSQVEAPSLPNDQPHTPSGEGWNETRLTVRQLLFLKASPLVPLYDAAVRMLHDDQFPARQQLLAHCVREISNSLPFYFDGAITGNVDYPGLVKPLVDPWTSAGLPLGTEAPPVAVTGQQASELATVAVPHNIVRQMGKLVEAHTNGFQRRQHNASVLFRALAPDSPGDTHHLRQTIDLWLSTCGWFVRHAHHDRRPAADHVEGTGLDGEFVRRFERFEQLLYVMVQPFLSIAKSLDEDLEDANS